MNLTRDLPRRIHVLKIEKEVIRRADDSIREVHEYGPDEGWNILHDEGEQAILSAYFDTDLSGFGAAPSNLYLGLDDRASLAEDDTLSDLDNEPSGSGYARIANSTSSGFTISQPGAYYRAITATKTFTASGGPIPSTGVVSVLFLTTASSGTSGKLICSIALSGDRSLADGESLDVTLSVGLSE